MKNKDVYVGIIKKCNNLYFYERYGEKRFVGDCQIGPVMIGSIHTYVDVVAEKAILIKVNEEQFIWLDDLNNFVDGLLVDLGFPIKLIGTVPFATGELFVDKDSLVPYYIEEEKKTRNLKVRQLKKDVLIDSRIKGGVEH